MKKFYTFLILLAACFSLNSLMGMEKKEEEKDSWSDKVKHEYKALVKDLGYDPKIILKKDTNSVTTTNKNW